MELLDRPRELDGLVSSKFSKADDIPMSDLKISGNGQIEVSYGTGCLIL